MTWLQGKIVVAEGRGRGMRRMVSRCTCEQGSKYVVKRGEREERREKREERREKREEREREKWGQLL
jgi:NAD(P)-dependent dehydrogenase (short-subunit alcohol dehydrogenase family)